MKFGNIFNTYIKENNLRLNPIKESKSTPQLLLETFLLEGKKDLYKDLIISNNSTKVAPEDVAQIKFYVKGKSAKDGKTPEEAADLNKKQAELFNKIFAKINADSKDKKTTLIELTAAALNVFKADGQNKPTSGYNLRGVLTVLISNKKMLAPVEGKVNASNIIVDPGDGVIDTEDSENPNEPDTNTTKAASSKFDDTLKQNEPAEDQDIKNDNSKSYLKAEASSVERGDFETRDERIAANYILATLREELPGFFNKESLAAQVEEEQGGMSPEEVNSLVDQLVKKGKITLVAKSSSEDAVPDEQDDEEHTSTTETEDPRDFVDKQISGSTRKGFEGGNFDYSGFEF